MTDSVEKIEGGRKVETELARGTDISIVSLINYLIEQTEEMGHMPNYVITTLLDVE